jgi:hypothetical protein
VTENSYNGERNIPNQKQASSLIETNICSPINKENMEKIQNLR